MESSIDPGSREVFCDGKRVELTTFEFDILEMLMRSAGRVLSRDALMEALYNRKATPFDRSIDMHISHSARSSNAATSSDQDHSRRGISVLPHVGGSGGLNTVFAKMLLWFFGTVVLTFTALIITAAINFDPGERRPGPVGALIRLQFAESRHAYEVGGVPALRETLDRFARVTETEGVLTDARGRDLVTGEDRSDLVDAARERSRIPLMRRDRTVFGRRSADGQYFYFLMLQGRELRHVVSAA